MLSTNQMKALLLLSIVTALIIVLGNRLAGPTGIWIGMVLACLLNCVLYCFADRMILSLYEPTHVTSDDEGHLYAIAAYLCEKIKLPVPKLYVLEQGAPTVFTLGQTRAHSTLIVTRGLLNLLKKDELAGVIAHEITHIKNGDIFVTTFAAGLGAMIIHLANKLYSFLQLSIKAPAVEKTESNTLVRLLMQFMGPFLAVLVHMSLSQHREFDADEKAIEICDDANGLSQALQKLERVQDQFMIPQLEQNPFTAPLFIQNALQTKFWKLLFSTHPSLVARINYLESITE